MQIYLDQWPEEIVFIRHADAYFNAHKRHLETEPLYLEFLEEYQKWNWVLHDPKRSRELLRRARRVVKHLTLPNSDYNARLTDKGYRDAYALGERMPKEFPMPDVVYGSPYIRVVETFQNFGRAFPRLSNLTYKADVRLRGHEKGEMNLFNDWRLFTVFRPEQLLLRRKEGSFYYRYPSGENIPDIQMRVLSWAQDVLPKHMGQKVWVFCHHTTIQCFRALVFGMTSAEYEKVDLEEEPPNCSITVFRSGPEERGEKVVPFGKLKMVESNLQYVP